MQIFRQELCYPEGWYLTAYHWAMPPLYVLAHKTFVEQPGQVTIALGQYLFKHASPGGNLGCCYCHAIARRVS